MHNIDLLPSTLEQKDDKVIVGYSETASYMLFKKKILYKYHHQKLLISQVLYYHM